jgi:hypothetical protein
MYCSMYVLYLVEKGVSITGKVNMVSVMQCLYNNNCNKELYTSKYYVYKIHNYKCCGMIMHS